MFDLIEKQEKISKLCSDGKTILITKREGGFEKIAVIGESLNPKFKIPEVDVISKSKSFFILRFIDIEGFVTIDRKSLKIKRIYDILPANKSVSPYHDYAIVFTGSISDRQYKLYDFVGEEIVREFGSRSLDGI